MSFGAVVENLDLKSSVNDWTDLADQLIHPLAHQGAIPVGVDINPVRRPRTFAVEEHWKPDGSTLVGRSQDEVHVARVELVRDPATGPIERGRIGADAPDSREFLIACGDHREMKTGRGEGYAGVAGRAARGRVCLVL